MKTTVPLIITLLLGKNFFGSVWSADDAHWELALLKLDAFCFFSSAVKFTRETEVLIEVVLISKKNNYRYLICYFSLLKTFAATYRTVCRGTVCVNESDTSFIFYV